MIVGIGTDIIEVKRVKTACERGAFLTRYFTSKEISFLKENYQSIASNFAVKESVAKAFGTGFRGFEMIEIEVLRDELGAPYVCLYGNALEKANSLHVDKIHVSISNIAMYATAYVVCERL